MGKQMIGVGVGLLLMAPAAAWSVTVAEARFNEMIKEGVPPQAPESQVTTFLFANRLSYSESQSATPIITVTVEPSPQNYLVKGALHVTFTFNANKQLTGYTVHEDPPADSGNASPANTGNASPVTSPK